MKAMCLSVAVSVLLALHTLSVCGQSSDYSLNVLGPIENWKSDGDGTVDNSRYNGINNNGVATFFYQSSPSTGVIWQNGSLSYVSSSPVRPVGISDNSIIAGNQGGAPYAASSAVGSQNLITTDPYSFGSVATGISANGSLVSGYSWRHSSQMLPVPIVWNLNSSTYTTLSLSYPYVQGQANSVNNSGVSVGFAYQNGGSPQIATMWNSDGGMSDLGMGNGSWATAVNNKGDIIGHSASGAFLLNGDGLVSLNNILGNSYYALSLNDSDQVVGWSHDSGAASDQHQNTGWLYDDGATINLNTVIPTGTGLWIDQAEAINNNGQILAIADDGHNNDYELLLTPVPEPTTLTLVLCGIGLFLPRLRKR